MSYYQEDKNNFAILIMTSVYNPSRYLYDGYKVRDVHPDLIIKWGKDIVEVKFLSSYNLIQLRLIEAEEELKSQIDKLKEYNIIEKLGLKYKTIILIYYNFRERTNRGVLLIKRSLIKGEKHDAGEKL